MVALGKLGSAPATPTTHDDTKHSDAGVHVKTTDAAWTDLTDGLDSIAHSHTHSHTHASTSGQTANDHHNQAHAIGGADHTGSLDHTALGSVTSDQHHAKAHDHTTSDGSGVLTNDEHDGYSEYTEMAAPGTPAANKLRLYAKDKAGVSTLYYKKDDGTEVELGAAAGGGHTIQDESVSLATARTLLNFKGQLIEAVDDGVDSTDVYAGYREYDAIVDSAQYNATPTTIPVYTTLQAAITAGHTSILFRQSTDGAAITSVGSVEYIMGDTLASATIPVALTVDKAGCVINNIGFANVAVTLSGVGTTLLGCQITGTTTINMTGSGAALIACAFTVTGTTCVTMNSSDQRVQACRSQLGSTTVALIGSGSSCLRPTIVGNAFAASSETGTFIDLNTPPSLTAGSINGNTISLVAGMSSAAKPGVGTNISGNVINVPTLNNAAHNIKVLDGLNRNVISGNIFYCSTVSATAQLRLGVLASVGAGVIIMGNLSVHGTTGANSTLICWENAATGTFAAFNNYAALIGSWASTAIGGYVNTNGSSVVMKGNVIGGTGSGGGIQMPQIYDGAGASVWNPQSTINSNEGMAMPDIGVRYYKSLQDFDQVAWGAPSAVDPAGWARTINGAGTISYPVGTRGGVATLTTGGVSGNDVALYLGSDISAPKFVAGGTRYKFNWQANLHSLSRITDVIIRVGFTTVANWAAFGGGALLTTFTDYCLWEFDPAINANWQLRIKSAASENIATSTSAGAAAAQIDMVMMADNVPNVQGFINGIPVRIIGGTINTSLGANLMAPGIFIETLTGSAVTAILDFIAWEGPRV